MQPHPLDTTTASSRAALNGAISAFRAVLGALAVMSGVTNVLMLTGAFFMLEIYDRVLPSRSVPTLVGLTILAVALYLFSALIELVRCRVLTRIAMTIDLAFSRRIFEAVVRLPLKLRGDGDGLQPSRDLDTIRTFLAGPGPLAFLDLPWIPVYLLICFYFHVAIGAAAALGALALVAVTITSEYLTRGPTSAATQSLALRNGIVLAARRNAEAVQAMGMGIRFADLWDQANRRHVGAQQTTADIAAALGALSKALRLLLQSALLGIGAYLAIQQRSSAGIIVAASIIGARALAPVDMAIACWRGFVLARQSWARINRLLALMPRVEPRLALRRPQASLDVEDLSVAAPGDTRLIVQNATFTLKAGQALGIIGPTAAGKSTLARALVGAWSPARGKIRLDSAALEQWPADTLGRHIGYLPQDVELFDGTVAQNIARFEREAAAKNVIRAAELAGVHDLILHLPNGYETQIGEGGTALSAGQRQRIALARALYGNPFLIVLDEPNSNLDGDGEQSLTAAILKARARGAIVVVIAHRASALAGTDQVLMMAAGRIQALGPKDEVLNRVTARPTLPGQRIVAAGSG
jgi:ATP-binding cassette subfamily C protein